MKAKQLLAVCLGVIITTGTGTAMAATGKKQGEENQGIIIADKTDSNVQSSDDATRGLDRARSRMSEQGMEHSKAQSKGKKEKMDKSERKARKKQEKEMRKANNYKKEKKAKMDKKGKDMKVKMDKDMKGEMDKDMKEKMGKDIDEKENQ